MTTNDNRKNYKVIRTQEPQLSEPRPGWAMRGPATAAESLNQEVEYLRGELEHMHGVISSMEAQVGSAKRAMKDSMEAEHRLRSQVRLLRSARLRTALILSVLGFTAGLTIGGHFLSREEWFYATWCLLLGTLSFCTYLCISAVLTEHRRLRDG